MRPLPQILFRTVCCGLLAISCSLRGAGAEATAGDRDVRQEAPVTLDPVKVTTDPFSLWGISVAGHISLRSRLAGGPPKELYVGLVYASSPADRAGVQSGDQIIQINGTLLSGIPWRDLVKQMRYSEKGRTISLTLFNWMTSETRTVEFKLGATGSGSSGVARRRSTAGACSCSPRSRREFSSR
ncbi:MAG TPA: PDZ domain-containing protein [Opitutaceae bacterium]|nr:PDZ domain-containing protein [Opitutaceae bacterium]